MKPYLVTWIKSTVLIQLHEGKKAVQETCDSSYRGRLIVMKLLAKTAIWGGKVSIELSGR